MRPLLTHVLGTGLEQPPAALPIQHEGEGLHFEFPGGHHWYTSHVVSAQQAARQEGSSLAYAAACSPAHCRLSYEILKSEGFAQEEGAGAPMSINFQLGSRR